MLARRQTPVGWKWICSATWRLGNGGPLRQRKVLTIAGTIVVESPSMEDRWPPIGYTRSWILETSGVWRLRRAARCGDERRISSPGRRPGGIPSCPCVLALAYVQTRDVIVGQGLRFSLLFHSCLSLSRCWEFTRYDSNSCSTNRIETQTLGC